MPVRLHSEMLKNAKQVNLSKAKGLGWKELHTQKGREVLSTRLSLTSGCYQGLESCGMLKAAETGATEASMRYRPPYQPGVRLKGPFLQQHLSMTRISTYVN